MGVQNELNSQSFLKTSSQYPNIINPSDNPRLQVVYYGKELLGLFRSEQNLKMFTP